MFKIVGYHIPASAISTEERRATACKLLNIPNTMSKDWALIELYLSSGANNMGFNPAIYNATLDEQGIKKQKQFSKLKFDANCIDNNILTDMTANDVRVLVKTSEEFSQTRHFSRVFPSTASHQYFQYFDSISYYDRLLDAFVRKFSETCEDGLQLIDGYCQTNVHQ